MTPLILVLAVLSSSEAARILAFFPFPARSHHFVFRPVLEELAKRDHEILYLTSFPYDVPPKGIKQINIKRYVPKSSLNVSWADFGEMDVPRTVIALYEIGIKMAHSLLGNAEVQELVHSHQKFDAVMFESYFVQEYLSPLIHKFGAVGVEIMPLGDCAWVNELSGLPDNPSYQLDYKKEHTNDMDFWNRLHNLYVQTTVVIMGYFYLARQQTVADTYFNYSGWEERPPLHKLVSNRSLILVNSHFAIGYPTPKAPHKLEIGGVNIKANKPLPKDLQKYMDESKQGVIYMSLGSNVNVSDPYNLPMVESFMSVFKQLPHRVLMKWEKANYPGQLPPNVRIGEWFPQQDILAHKNCILFITHGGYLSITESVYFGVPLVGIPLFGDQGKNMVLVEEAGYGKTLRYRNITKDTVSWVLKEVLTNKRYKEEALRRSKIFRDRRHSPAEEAAYWIEHAIKYPNALTPKAATLTFVQLHLLDIHLFLGLVVLAAGFFLNRAVCLCLSLCRTTKQVVKPKVKKS